MSNKSLKLLGQRILLLDGGMGTMLVERGLKPGQPPEEMILQSPDTILDIHREYVKAGADVISTCTFGANRIKLEDHCLDSKIRKIVTSAVKLAKKASAGKSLVAASIGPTGKFVEPIGELKFDDAVKIYAELGKLFASGGVDIFLLETFEDIQEIKAAIIGLKSQASTHIFAQMTFDETGRTTLGSTPEVAAIVLDSLGVSAIGSNCGIGPEGMVGNIERMAPLTRKPLLAQANAGSPEMLDGKTVYRVSPKEFTRHAMGLLKAHVSIIGGCCGTTPDHIASLKEAVRKFEKGSAKRKRPRPFIEGTKLASRQTHVVFGYGNPPIIVGERINPTGRKSFQAEIKSNNLKRIVSEARAQVAEGAHVLDVNIGVPGTDEVGNLAQAVVKVQQASDVPLVIDSSSAKAIEAALKMTEGKPLINSVNGKEDSLKSVIPLAAKYGAALVGLCLDKDGIPKTAKGRLKIARKILSHTKKAGIDPSDLVIDPITMPVSSGPQVANEILETLKAIKETFGLSTIQGVSNVSFGLPMRPVLSASHLSMALHAGLDAAIMNPATEKMMEAFNASRALLGKDEAARKYIDWTQKATTGGPHFSVGRESRRVQETSQIAGDPIKALKHAVIIGDKEHVVEIAEAALKDGKRALEISDKAILPALDEIGKQFGAKKLFLPQLMLSADAAQKAFERLKKEMKASEMPRSKGKIILATVEGDIHDIGKNIVSTLLANNGFEVIDLGKSVPSKEIFKAAMKEKAQLVGLSALMTTTVGFMAEAIEMLRPKGFKIIVGGAVLTSSYAKEIRAHAYASDAAKGVELANKLIKSLK